MTGKHALNGIFVSLAVALSLSLGASAMADDGATAAPNAGAATAQGQRHHRHHKGMRKVFQACAKANGITLPAQGSGQSLSAADRTALRSCFQQFRADVQTCLQNAGISKPQPGQRPSAADRAAFKQCRTQALSAIAGASSSGS